MKRKTLIITATVLGISALAAGGVMAKAKCHGMYGGYMRGACMQDGGMMGPGMKHGMKHGFGRGGCKGGAQALDTPLSVEDVRAKMEQRLEWRGNDRLKVGEVKELDEKTIVAEIVTVDNSLVEKIQIDKATGRPQRVQ